MKKIIQFSSALLLITLTSFSQSVELAVIVNPENPITSISESEAKLYWLRRVKKRWPEINKNIKPADRTTSCPEQNAFYSKVLKMSVIDVENYFSQKQYESGEKPQDKLLSDAAIIDFVSREPGAIGFVNVNALTAEAKTKVKVVLLVK
jgi:ABC-type phosphate transport system substrate-binding protein